jgi:hypothetical protein
MVVSRFQVYGLGLALIPVQFLDGRLTVASVCAM